MKCNDIEIWKDIPGYEGYYQASTFGNIRSLNYNRTGEIKNLSLIKAGKYYQVVIHKKHLLVHILVYKTFYGSIKPGYEINHIDENKLNNHYLNLCQMSHIDNCNYGTRNKRISTKRKNKYSVVQQINIKGEVIAEFNGIMDVQNKLGYHNTCISKCCLGHRKTAYGYYWKYKGASMN